MRSSHTLILVLCPKLSYRPASTPGAALIPKHAAVHFHT